MDKLIIFVIFMAIVASCKNNDAKPNIHDIYNTLTKDKLLEKYKGYDVVPVTRGFDKIYISFPDSVFFYVRGFDAGASYKLRLVKYTSLQKQFLYELKSNPSDTSLLNRCYDILLELTRLNIIALTKNHKCKCKLIYTNITCPTPNEGKYVLIYDTTNTILNQSKCFFDNKGRISKISKDWYYYSSTLYSKYDKFH